MTKRYVFSFINFFDNNMTSQIIESDHDIFTVAKSALLGKGYEPYEDIEDVDGLKEFAFDCDSMFEIIEI